MTYTAQDFLREMWPVIEETPAGDIAERIAEEHDLWFEPCDHCHGDGEHETFCVRLCCDFCGQPPVLCPGNCTERGDA